MRKLITTFAILIAVLVAGMTALVLLVNPNDFKSYMVQQVKKRSGYQLVLNGDLRWHVWPKLSILSGPMSLTAPGAAQPTVTADNMRLDVELLPLLSHQLHISNILITHAVIQAIPESAAQSGLNTPIAPDDPSSLSPTLGHWSLDIARVAITNSLLVWQDPQGEQLNFRNLTLRLHQDETRSGHYHLLTALTRNQQTFSVDLEGQMDASHYPYKLLFSVDRGHYQLQGVSLPEQGIEGDTSFNAEWSPMSSAFALTNFSLHANDSDFSGEANGSLAPTLKLGLTLHSQTANFDQLLLSHTSLSSVPSALPHHESTGGDGVEASHVRTPVVVEKNNRGFIDWLNQSDISSRLTADQATWHGVTVNDLVLDAHNVLGVMNLHSLAGKVGGGQFGLQGEVDFRPELTKVQLQTDVQRIPLEIVQPLLQLPSVLRGAISLQGQFTGQGLQGKDIVTQWQGQSSVELLGLDIPRMNVQQMVIDAVTRASNRVNADPKIHPVIPNMQGQFTLSKGQLQLTTLEGENDQVSLNALGNINFAQKNLDITFNLLTRGWKGDPSLIALLANEPIPLRFYGPWSHLQYALSVDRLLKNNFKSRVQQWLKDNEKTKNSSSGQ
ncbi:outer membrane assembly protein AsmA [Rosenbergiella australiborealis]|uniref:Outer membrane assembly protein AsmA n=1 Tax=Rosenbergiella australiborealis TaxID=1544696 RepID=A0ABS5T3G5_9GAMM|nr:outer membrane assembly protein AsmA [Rosenbergiella australiborealis]MBT0726866.1 outer membrane assembly protein AsmA [Rosenbergiella australiborealis]